MTQAGQLSPGRAQRRGRMCPMPPKQQYMCCIGCPRIIRTLYFDVLKEEKSNFRFRLYLATWSINDIVAHSFRNFFLQNYREIGRNLKLPWSVNLRTHRC